MAALLEATDLAKTFGHLTAVNGISFTVEKGEVMGFLGPNGAGKSTTMKMLTGFLRPTRGRARIAGFDVESQAIEAKRHLGYLPEGAPLYVDMTPVEFLSFVAAARGLDRRASGQAVERAIDATHIGGVAHQSIDTLSKGFKRRVGLAQAILHDPEVLVLDEPTDGLDPNQKHEVRRLIRTMAPGKAIVISTHILEEVEALCSRAIVIDRGRVVADSAPEELRRRSRHHNCVTLTVQGGDPDAVRGALQAVDRVARVEVAGTGPVTATVWPRDGVAVVEPVLQAIHRQGWTLVELAVDPGRLDDVFRSLTTGDADLEKTGS